MTYRRPAIGRTEPGGDLDKLRDVEDQLGRYRPLNGAWVTATFPAGARDVAVNHKLGRKYTSAHSFIVISGTLVTDVNGLMVRAPETVTNAQEQVTFRRDDLGGAAGTATVRAWVY